MRKFNRLIRAGQTESHEAAELFYYLNRTGYNGLCRFNQSGEFNVPFGRYKKITYRHDFREYAKTFGNWEFTNVHFRQLILHNMILSMQISYDVQFRQYSEGGFGWHEQVALAHWLQKHPGPVILVNQATDRIIEFMASWDIG